MKLGNATREYVANKQATGMVFETEACILRTFTEQLGANVAIRKITSDSVLNYLNGHGPVTLFWHRSLAILPWAGPPSPNVPPHAAIGNLRRSPARHRRMRAKRRTVGSSFVSAIT